MMAIPSHFSFLSFQSYHLSLSILLHTDRMFPPEPLRVSCITTQHNSKRASCSLTGKAYCTIRSLLPFLDCPFILRCQIRPVCFYKHCEICLVHLRHSRQAPVLPSLLPPTPFFFVLPPWS